MRVTPGHKLPVTDSKTLSISGRTPPHQLLQLYRNRSGLTQAQLGELLGISRRMVLNWEAGYNLPRPLILKRLVEVYLERGVFVQGEEYEVATLWMQVKEAFDCKSSSNTLYPVFDQAWFSRLLAKPAPQTSPQQATLSSNRATEEKDTLGLQHNLPASLTSFIGREEKLKELSQLLHQKRLVTLTGAGGTGKTRLALEVGRCEAQHFRDGIWLVELAALTRPELIVETVAKILDIDIKEAPGKSLEETLVAFLQPKELMLIVDNCEHLLTECARITSRLLATCPELKVLLTSREPLGLSGEWVVRVPSLEVPDLKQPPKVEIMAHFGAVKLFVERARAAEPDFALTEKNVLSVVEICTRLDGIPLALELAAVRLRGMSVGQLAARLATTFAYRFHLLASDDPVVLPRQQTLLALIEWSYNLLKEREQLLLKRLAVFAGDWELEAAEGICAGEFHNIASWGNLKPEEIAELLGQLVNKSLVQFNRQRGRYTMLETIRGFAWHKLEESGELETLERRHLEWYLALAEEGLSNIGTPWQATWFEQLERELANIRRAIDWAIRCHKVEAAARLALSLWQFWHNRFYQSEAAHFLEKILELPACQSLPGSMLARLYNAAGVISHTLQDFEKAEYYHRQALKLWQVEDDKGGIARALIDRGFQSWYEVKLAEAFEYAQTSLVAARTTNNKKLVGEALILGAASAIELDKLTLARTVLDESMEIWQELGDKPGQLSALNGYIRLEYLQGQRQKAKLYLEKALRLAAELEDYMGIIGVLVNMLYFSISAADKGKGARLAAQVMGAMASWEERVNGRKWAWSLQRLGEFEQQIKEVVGEAVLADEFNIGRTLTMSEMLALGFEIAQLVEPEQSSKPIAKSFQKSNHNHLLAVQPFHLTKRELEVLRLVALGRSNQEVAEELVISHRTVEAHLRSIFDKLEVSNRSAAIHFALEYGLVKLGS